MANSQRQEVNQRLYFCRLHLDWLAEQLSAQRLPKRVLEQSLGESIVLHLVMAYRAYLSEVASAYSVHITGLECVEQLIDALANLGFESAETRELLIYESAGQWLGRLLQDYQALGSLQISTQQNPSSSEILVAEVPSGPEFDLQQFESYFKSLSDVIENQRARLEEW